MTRALILALALPITAAAGATAWSAQPSDPVATQQERLRAARSDSEAALKRSEALLAEAARTRDAAARARAERGAIEAQIARAGADVVAARARIAIIDRRMAAQQARLAEQQQPTVRLVAAVQSLARRPEMLVLAQPGSLRDTVHARALLGSMLPRIEARSAQARAEVDRSRALRTQASGAVAGLRESAGRLDEQRLRLVSAEAQARLRAGQLARGALVESDRAIALGEEARDLIAVIDLAQDAAVTESRLAALSGPLPRPEGEAPVPRVAGAAPYRLPVAGRVETGFGELSDSGVRARGVALRATTGAVIAAPAAGRVVFARPFRRYGPIVIIDHGGGWSSLVTGLDELSVEPGARVARGDALGRAGASHGSPVTVELRRNGQPIDVAALTG